MPSWPRPIWFFLVLIIPAALAGSETPAGERGRIPREIVPFASDEAVRRIFSVAVDPRGRIVAANGRILLYDGWTARELTLPKPMDTGAVAVDAQGRIWTGNHEDLGWLAEQPDGEWKFTSIHDQLPAEARGYQLLWAVHCVGDSVFFVASQQLMIWREGQFTIVPLPNVRRLFSSTLGDHCYVWQRNRPPTGTHLWRFTQDGSREKILSMPDQFSGYDILAADGQGLEFVGEELSVQRYEWATKRMTDVLASLKREKLAASISGVHLPGGERIIGTADRGVVGFDAAGRRAWAMNVASGELPDNGVETLVRGAPGVVWGMTSRGLVGLETDPAITIWRAEEGLPVTVNAVIRFEGQLFIAAPFGLHQLIPDEAGGVAKFKLSSIEPTQHRDLALTATGQLLVAGQYSYARGTPELGFANFETEAGRTFFQLPQHPDLFVWADLDELWVLRSPAARAGSSGWPAVWKKKHALVDRVALWRGLEFVVANNSGAIDLYSLRRTGDGVEEAAPARRLTPASGLGRVLRFEQQGGWLLAFTRAGVWRWRETLDHFEPLPTDAPPGLVPFAFRFDGSTQGWAVATLARDALGSTESTRQLLLRAEWSADGSVRGLSTPAVAVVDDIDRLTCAFSEEGLWWLGGTGGLARVDMAALARSAPRSLTTAPYPVSVRQGEGVTTTGVVAAAAEGARSLEVEFGFPRHNHPLPVNFETRLSPLESDWSPPTGERRRTFSSLPGGNYELAVRVVDAAGQRSPEWRLPVRVQPRFRESGWFAAVLALGVVILSGLGFVGWTRRLRQRKAELEHTVGERTAALLATNEELRGQNQKRVELIGAVSHELRTPLTGAYLMAEKLVATDPGSDAEALRRCLAELRSLLEGALDLSRYELGLIPVQLRRIPLGRTVAEAVRLFQPLAAARRLTLTYDVPAADDPVLADEPNLRRILANLISNAVKYTEHGHAKVSLQWHPGPAPLRWAEITVSDTGRGLEPEALAGLFTEFQRPGLRDAGTGESAGLGLSLTKRLVDLAGGEITCESKPGIGSVFRVRLPVVDLASLEEGGSPFATGILLVEDEQAHRAHAVEMLEPLGASVTTAGSMAEALAAAGSTRFDLALVDFNLPDGTGLELLHRWRAEGHAPRRVVLVSSHRSAPIRDICLAAGFAEVLAKPLSVRAAVEQLML